MKTIDFAALERAVEAAQEAKAEIISIEANPSIRNALDASYKALSDAINNLTQLITPEENDNENL